MKNSNIDAGYRYPAQIISHTVWLYHRFTLSFRIAIYLKLSIIEGSVNAPFCRWYKRPRHL